VSEHPAQLLDELALAQRQIGSLSVSGCHAACSPRRSVSARPDDTRSAARTTETSGEHAR
jgi:hypothetical protein